MDSRRRRDRSVSRFSVAMGNSTMMSGGQGRKTIINPMTITRNALRVLQPYIWRKQDKRKDIDELNFQNKPSILMRDVTMVMSDNVSLPQLFRETSNILKSVTNSTGVMLYLVDSGANEIYLCPQNPENRSEQRISWKIQMGYSVAAHVAHEKEIICVNNLVKDDRFPSGLSWKGRTEAAVLCAPVVTGDDECFAIIELFRATNGPYENRHFQIVAAVTGWMGTAINENNRRVLYQKKEELNSCLQEIVQKYFGETIEVENLLVDIVRFAKSTLSADRGSFFVLDPDSQELGAECFDDTTPLNCNIDHFLAQKKKLKIRLNKEKGIAGLAASTGQIVNIKDAFNDPRFSREVDQKTGIITRSALCLPVEGKGGIVGVLQLMNKTNSESCFSKNDETLIRTFGVYCTIALHYKQVKENVEKSMLYNELYDEMYFHQISKNCPTFHEDVFPENFDDLMWYPEQDFIDDGNMLPCAIKMLKLIGNNRLHNVELFVHATSRAYRALPFHNFEFGFNVTHAIYCILTRNPTKFTHTERVALMIAGLCRAVDHRGVTSSYLKRTNHLLKRLYGHFIMPSHHVWVSKIIIKHTQLLKNYSKEEYSEIMSSYEDITLSTGSYSYSHIKYIHILNSITEANAFDWSNRKHRSFASKLLLKSAAISFKAKPYNIAMRLISNLYQEIYAQGDKERLIGQTPSDLIDRNKADKIPENEVNIINHFCIPCLELLDQIFVNVTDMLQASLQFRENWMHVIMHRGKRMWSPLEYNAKEETEEKKGKKFEATREDIDNLMFTSI